MKLQIEGKDYELTDECITQLLQLLKGPILSRLPGELRGTVENTNHPDQFPLLVEVAKDYGLGYYKSLSTPKRLLVMTFVRNRIAWFEKKFGDVARVLRPLNKRDDPVEHVVSVVYPVIETTVSALGEMLPYVTVTLTTDSKNITDIRFSLKG